MVYWDYLGKNGIVLARDSDGVFMTDGSVVKCAWERLNERSGPPKGCPTGL
jgi:hypothetical protein